MSLKYRIAATIFALEVVVIGAVLWITLSHSTQSVREQITRTEGVTLQLLADLSRAALLTDEFADLQTFIEGTRRDPRVITVVVGAADGRVVAATEPELIGAPFPELVVAREHRYWRQTEIRGHAGILGYLAIKFSNQPLMLAYEDTRNLGLSIAIIGMVAIAIVGALMGFLLTRRLDALAVAADRVAAGDLSIRVAPAGSDEVARVGRAFDSMVARLEAILEALKAARDQLIEPTEAMSEGFALWDAGDRLVRCNRRFRILLGPLDRDIALGMRFEDLCRLSYQRLLGGDPQGLDAVARRAPRRPSKPARPARAAAARRPLARDQRISNLGRRHARYLHGHHGIQTAATRHRARRAAPAGGDELGDRRHRHRRRRWRDRVRQSGRRAHLRLRAARAGRVADRRSDRGIRAGKGA